MFLPLLGNLPVERAKDAVCFLQQYGVSLVSSYAVCFLQLGGVSLAPSAVIYNIVKVIRKSYKKCYKQVADWHEVCAESHTQARDAFHLWCTNGRPRSGPIYQLMKSKGTEFKMAIRKCKEVKEQKESDRLALKLLKGDSEHFWREIRQINARNKPVSLAETVGGVTGVSEISTMWKDHFQALLNSVPSSSLDLSLHDCCLERFTPSEIAEVVSTLKNGKSPGSDQIAAEHVKYAGGRVIILLSLLLNACICHKVYVCYV